MMNVELCNISKFFESQCIFRDFSCSFGNGEITAVSGGSGMGKSTLLRMIAGLDKGYSGEINNVPERFSYLFQENALLPWCDVMDNIRFVMDDDRVDIKRLLSFTGLHDHVHKFPEELSGGMQRRVALCRCFAYPADLILLDEPFSGLDKTMKQQIANDFLALVRGKVTTIIVSHDEDIMDLCDKIVEIGA